MFNQQARWDRDLPCQDNDYGQMIAVTCLMDRGKIIPRSFIWKNRDFPVNKVNFQWTAKQGREDLIFYSVQTPAGTYELVFRAGCRSWHLRGPKGP